MELISEGHSRCNCHEKLKIMEGNLNADGTYLNLGALIRCDCDVIYELSDDQRDGRHWRPADVVLA